MKIHSDSIQQTIDKHKLVGKRVRKEIKKWSFTLGHMQTLMEIHSMNEYLNNRKILTAVNEFLKTTDSKARDGFNKFIDYQEKRLKKYQK